MPFVEILLLSLSLSADSFVVSLGGSVTLGRVNVWKVFSTASVFGVVQAACLFTGWISGYSIVAYVSRIAPYIALVILSYLGIRMIVSGLRGDGESVDLSGFRKMMLAAIATSIDAIAVGVSLAMGNMNSGDAAVLTVLTLLITIMASSAGIVLGSASGRKFGNAAKIAGGAILVFIGCRALF